jgi:hypothetical protein
VFLSSFQLASQRASPVTGGGARHRGWRGRRGCRLGLSRHRLRYQRGPRAGRRIRNPSTESRVQTRSGTHHSGDCSCRGRAHSGSSSSTRLRVASSANSKLILETRRPLNCWVAATYCGSISTATTCTDYRARLSLRPSLSHRSTWLEPPANRERIARLKRRCQRQEGPIRSVPFLERRSPTLTFVVCKR